MCFFTARYHGRWIPVAITALQPPALKPLQGDCSSHTSSRNSSQPKNWDVISTTVCQSTASPGSEAQARPLKLVVDQSRHWEACEIAEEVQPPSAHFHAIDHWTRAKTVSLWSDGEIIRAKLEHPGGPDHMDITPTRSFAHLKYTAYTAGLLSTRILIATRSTRCSGVLGKAGRHGPCVIRV